MTTLNLPVFPADPDYRYNIQLDGGTYILEFHLNARADRWNLSIFDVENQPIRTGVRLVTGIDLLGHVASLRKPPGKLTVVDTTGQDLEPNAETLGDECLLRYIEEADL
jgi:hypothetical protein